MTYSIILINKQTQTKGLFIDSSGESRFSSKEYADLTKQTLRLQTGFDMFDFEVVKN